MRSIYKYPLKNVPHQTIEMPRNSKVLSVSHQDKELVVWAEVNPREEFNEGVFFFLVETGKGYLERGTQNVFLGTIQIPLASEYVVHVFYEKLAV